MKEIVRFFVVLLMVVVLIATLLEVSQSKINIGGVYVLKSMNAPSWFDEDGVEASGIHHDFVMLVNPIMEGDRVYSQEGIFGSLKDEDRDWFFFADQLQRVTDPVFRIKPEAKVYQLHSGETDYCLAEQGGKYPYLWNPRTQSGRVYVNQDILTLPDNTGDNYFIRREDVTLVNPTCIL